MGKVESVFIHYIGKSRGNMVKGRRKRVQTRNTIRTRAAVLSPQYDITSPMKKEAKLHDSNVKNVNSDEIHSVSEAHKVPMCISSFFYTQITDVPKNKASILPIEERFYGSKETNDVQNDILTDVGQFRTDETPVAVPIHGPSTPHRINMPNHQLEDLDERNTNENMHKKPVVTPTLNLEQQPLKKSANHSRRKLTSNQSATNRSIDSSNTKSTNHKLTDYFPVRRSVRKSKKAVLEEKQRDMENKVLYQVEEGLEVRHFAGKGRGVVTTREFMKGEFVVEYIGELIDQVTAKKREKIYAQDQNTGCYMYYFQHRNHQYCVDATAETDKLGRLVNHSRNGNLIARVIEVESTPHLVLTAKENIPIGVEITYDYGDRSREAIRHHPWLAL
ncbi:N-lysine methyltransferase KMT5A-A isoform X1 [Bombus vosnesenskii]|uniref:[histone H4]-lysine(20) N-methyltransferase n=2 Tax=Bombus vosnesenskii TaxID=207650 RepID=A0A6J3K6H7_9HYME|nr:N-lysine methyltransferase KMT5A-A isoform X1 [Bombus vosnesenskii]